VSIRDISAQKRVVVTGGAGFLGSHVCERLSKQGHEVLCVDNFYTGNRHNVAGLLSNPFFDIIHHDVVHPLSVQVDEIYHLACPASPVHYQYDPIHTIKTSVLGTMNMLGLAKHYGAKILHASTSEVYGDPDQHPQSESYFGNVNTFGVRACYDEGKRCAEALCHDYLLKHGVRVKVARIFNTYGPRMRSDDGRVVSNFIVQALRGDPLTIYGDGSQTRSFCYVDDLVDAFLAFMGGPDGFPGPLNLGNPCEMTVAELAEMVIELTGSPSRLERKPLPGDDPKQRRPDIRLAAEKLGWEPKVGLEDGLRRTIAYFEDLLSGKTAAVQISAA
jgi:UDP-glucuronate decarboxylase